jgi:hypothetical protein
LQSASVVQAHGEIMAAFFGKCRRRSPLPRGGAPSLDGHGRRDLAGGGIEDRAHCRQNVGNVSGLAAFAAYLQPAAVLAGSGTIRAPSAVTGDLQADDISVPRVPTPVLLLLQRCLQQNHLNPPDRRPPAS